MELLLLAIYAAICIGVFKLLKVPANPWTVMTAALGGVFMIGALLVVMNYNHPYTPDARIYFYTTPIVPQVRGRVIEVAVKPNEPLKMGDVLFRIDPQPFQFAVDEKRAALAEAQQNVRQLTAAFDQATAGVDKARAQLELAQQTYDRQHTLLERQVVAQATVDTASRNLEASRQTLLQAEAAAERARLAAASRIDGVNTTVARLQAELRDAQFDLDQTVVRAPGDGYVAQMFLRPGNMAVPLPLNPAMIFIHQDQKDLVAAFPQNALQRLNPGDEAEVSFAAMPARIFTGKVRRVVDAVSQGQLQPSPTLINPEDRFSKPGRALVAIDLTSDVSAYNLPGGAIADVAVYTDHARPLALLRRILLRMKSWLNFISL
ncbi:MAG: secretion protein HylD [Alphaproteobacteria bacterium 65-37]|nr:MAG: secretion protein HylD [Alphaproteobacteria bacterium 65-37]